MADHSVTLALVLPKLEASAALAYRGPRTTDTSNAFDGAECGGTALVTYNPPVATGSAPLAESVDIASAFPLPDLNSRGWPTSDDPDAVSFLRPKTLGLASHVDRILVGHKDITWFRASSPGDEPIQMPGYTLTEPFGYGASKRLIIRRTNSLFEKYGHGALRWLHQGARVQYQRVYDLGGEDQRIVVDYRGVIEAVLTDEVEFQVQIGGEVFSPAGTRWKPPPKRRKLYDLGQMVDFACSSLGIHLEPAGGPTTGITYPNQGGLYFDAWLANLSAMSRDEDTSQRVLMPFGIWGGTRWSFSPKDTTTVDVTAYADGAAIAVSIADDALEQPTRVFGNGVDPNGERWDGGVYPGIAQGFPIAYPNDDDRDIAIGDTNADTDSGFGITAMCRKLNWDGLLAPSAANNTAFDGEVGRAVKLLKTAAGMTPDAVMNPAAWAALWDTDAVGFLLNGAQILPIAVSPTTEAFIRTPGGSIIGRNPQYIPGRAVDVSIDYGVVDEDHARRNARSIIRAGSSHQWAGTITFNQVHAWAGELHDSDIAGLTTADIMRARDIRPGMNIRLPHFESSTVFHIASVTVSPGPGGDTVSLMVDTGARDYFDLSQALRRNKESRSSPYREKLAENRGWKPPGNLTTRDRYFGRLYQDVDVRGGRWNDFPIIMGQSGTVGYTDIQLRDLATEFTIVVTSNYISPAKMARIIGNPHHVDDSGQTAFETSDAWERLVKSKLLLYVAGAGVQRAGFGWKKGYTTNSDGATVRTSAPLTGEHVDGASWPYVTNPVTAPLAYALLFPARSATVEHGRLFWALEDDVT